MELETFIIVKNSQLIFRIRSFSWNLSVDLLPFYSASEGSPCSLISPHRSKFDFLSDVKSDNLYRLIISLMLYFHIGARIVSIHFSLICGINKYNFFSASNKQFILSFVLSFMSWWMDKSCHVSQVWNIIRFYSRVLCVYFLSHSNFNFLCASKFIIPSIFKLPHV